MTMSQPFTISATDPDSGEVHHVTVEPGQTVGIGRAAENELPLAWDREVSRRHATAEIMSGGLNVICREGAQNPLIIGGAVSREIYVKAGDEFQIGRTVFHVDGPGADPAAAESTDVDEYSLSGKDLGQFQFGDSGKQLQLLCDLPGFMARAESNVERQQAKVGVFGPVVNQGARIEGLTRQFDVAICIDEATAQFARSGLSPSQARVRRLARIRPKGMDTPVNISELLAPADNSTVTDDHIAACEAALDQVIAGESSSAIEELNGLPEEGPISFLLREMSQLENRPPADWDGAFTLTSK